MSAAVPGVAIHALPDAAWRGLAGRYRNIVSPCTEAPDVFHLASFIAAVGCLIGRRAWVCCPHATFPNFYCLLIGRTANARKTTAYQFALNLFEDTAELLGDTRPKRLNGLASPEGLAQAMIGKEPPEESHRILCVEDEFRSLMTKGTQGGVANLIPKLTELFNCPGTFEVNTKKDALVVRDPFLCILAASTRAWFEESVTKRDVSGGFLNRWLLFEGDRDKLLPSPPPPDLNAWEDLVLEVTIAVEEAVGRFEFTHNAREFYEDFYRTACREFDAEATARTDTHARKLSLLYAILANRSDHLIRLDDIHSGVEVATYCARVVEPIAAALDASPRRRLEQRLVERITKEPGLKKRDLYRPLHKGITEFNPVLESLIEVGIIYEKDERYYPG
jgi:hypothetical protein